MHEAAGVKENILAFHMITTILAKIQQHSFISDDDLKPKTEKLEQYTSIHSTNVLVKHHGHESFRPKLLHKWKGGGLSKQNKRQRVRTKPKKRENTSIQEKREEN